MLKLLRIALIAGAALPASGCYSYLARQDLIEPYSGDAVATNLALQMADPWPRYVYDTDIETSGRRQANAYETYAKEGEEVPPAPMAPLQLVVPKQ